MKGSNKVTTEDFITIETHFGVSGHFIRAVTRNKCSEDLVEMIQEVSRILFPDDSFDIYLLPPEPGSYRDIIKFVKKHKVGTTVVTAVTVGGLAIAFLTYKDSHESHVHDAKMWIVDDVARCLELKKTVEDLSKTYTIENIPEEKITEVCGNLNLKKRKNNFYNVLQGDGMVKNNEVILKDAQNQSVFSKNVERGDFYKCIEAIPDQQYSQENIEGVIEIIAPVVKQKKEGKGIAWRGTYYGVDIFFNNIPVLKNGEDVDFYMQDADFKNQISNKERTFAIGDNMRIIFNVTGELKGEILQNRSIYIKKVINYNEDIIPHKVKATKNSESISDNQIPLL